MQSRYYDPVVNRFINADSYASTGQGFLGYNMFAYCGNNPVTLLDDTGHLFDWIGDAWDWLKDTASHIEEKICDVADEGWNCLCTVSGNCLYLVGDVASLVGWSDFASYEYWWADFWLDMGGANDTGENSSQTIIYRYYSTKSSNLVPRTGIDYDGLSFSTVPPSKRQYPAVKTTIEAINATGVLTVVQNGSHVSVVPVNGTVSEWMNQGESSDWTQILSSIVIEIGD